MQASLWKSASLRRLSRQAEIGPVIATGAWESTGGVAGGDLERGSACRRVTLFGGASQDPYSCIRVPRMPSRNRWAESVALGVTTIVDEFSIRNISFYLVDSLTTRGYITRS
jgi:hypothetical protein